MNFKSDNVTSAAPEILEALIRANAGSVPSYGDDPLTVRVEEKLAELFGTELRAFPVATGTAANALALACLTPPWGAVYCHADGHINVDECGAPEFYSGAKLLPLPGAAGMLAVDTLAAALEKTHFGFVHAVQPTCLSLSQATESGTVYAPAEVAALADTAKKYGLSVHMDGARFANAVAHLGCSPAEVTWKAGVDVLSFGATKNGGLAAEAVIFFNPALADSFAYRRKRAGHLFSKARFLSAQLDAYLTDGLWLRLAHHANAQAQRLATGLASLPGARLRHPVQANEVFIDLPELLIQGLEAAGYGFYRWDSTLVRLVTAWNTRDEDIEALLATATGLVG